MQAGCLLLQAATIVVTSQNGQCHEPFWPVTRAELASAHTILCWGTELLTPAKPSAAAGNGQIIYHDQHKPLTVQQLSGGTSPSNPCWKLVFCGDLKDVAEDIVLDEATAVAQHRRRDVLDQRLQLLLLLLLRHISVRWLSSTFHFPSLL
ncbi:unnamed protein product [Fraxinus pennsylvanica]|uniref:Uncharacterized protein n=1 Tax=Fraxinus pennsylvanica TaxID=56036 RepID=A0AAD2DQX4_9LAMI|nr:unnamed protein product [Fraxinus pennsylvanica]